jgi:hypothetical protein
MVTEEGRQRRSCQKEAVRMGDGHGGPPVGTDFLRLCHGKEMLGSRSDGYEAMMD